MATGSTSPPPWRRAANPGSGSVSSRIAWSPLAGLWRSSRPRDGGPSSRPTFRWRRDMPLRILLADDHMIVRQGLRALLERAGLEVVAEATDGQEAVTLAEKTKPDVAVLDLMMPTLNGIDAGRQILQQRK